MMLRCECEIATWQNDKMIILFLGNLHICWFVLFSPLLFHHFATLSFLHNLSHFTISPFRYSPFPHFTPPLTETACTWRWTMYMYLSCSRPSWGAILPFRHFVNFSFRYFAILPFRLYTFTPFRHLTISTFYMLGNQCQNWWISLEWIGRAQFSNNVSQEFPFLHVMSTGFQVN